MLKATAARAEAWACAFAGLLALLAYAWLYLPQLPATGAHWGDDYSYYLPSLLAGCYWQAQNGFAIPWFTPSQCGGLPYVADLNVGYYSVPQWLAFVAGPIPAVRWTFLLFAALGAAGFCLLLADRFRASRLAALTGAVLFLFGGFYTARMLVGHLTFHPFVLVPWIAWAVLAPATSVRQAVMPVILAGVGFAYMFHAGMVHGILPALLAIVVVIAVHGQLAGHRPRSWLMLGAAAALALAVSAQRLAAAAAFLVQFPRADYALPGFRTLFDAAQAALVLLFWRPPYHRSALLVNQQWNTGVEEFIFGVGPAALVALLAGAYVIARRRALPGRPAVWCLIAALASIPLFLNWYYEPWNAWLKSLPFFGSSSLLLRWFAVYVPVVVLFAALAVDRAAPVGWPRRLAALAMVIATVAWNALIDESRAYDMEYDAAPIQRAWSALAREGAAPPVERIGEYTFAHDLDRNDALASGASQLECYQPIFGYRLEHFPRAPLHAGPALAEAAPGVLNVKNPACYVFAKANGCEPGAHFTVTQRAQAERFLRYEAFAFATPWWQTAANVVSALALAATALALLGGVFLARPGRR